MVRAVQTSNWFASLVLGKDPSPVTLHHIPQEGFDIQYNVAYAEIKLRQIKPNQRHSRQE